MSARDLQNALLFVLALYASVALLNLRSEVTAIAQHWQSFVEFLVTMVFRL